MVEESGERVHERLESPLYGALVQASETVSTPLGADVVIGRLRCPGVSAPTGYVGTPGVAVDGACREELQAWSSSSPALQDYLVEGSGEVSVRREQGPSLPPVRAAGDSSGDGAALKPLNEVLTLRLPLTEEAVCVLLFFRCGAERGWFETTEEHWLRSISPALRRLLLRGYQQQKQAGAGRGVETGTGAGAEAESLPSNLPALSPREREILEELRRQRTERQIAEILGRSAHTVHVHVKNIYRKLGVGSRRELLELVEANEAAGI